VPRTHPPSSGDESILVDEVAQDVSSSELSGVDVADEGRSRVGVGRCMLAEGLVGTVRVVVLDVPGEHDFEVAPSEDEHPVQALAPDGADESLGEGVSPRRPDGCLVDRSALGGEDGVEGDGELGSITEEGPDCRGLPGEGPQRFGSVGSSRRPGIGGDAGDPDEARVVVNDRASRVAGAARFRH
jgi:hypothetical protein